MGNTKRRKNVYAGAKLKGTHHTVIDAAERFVRAADKESTVTGITISIIVKATKARSKYSAKRTHTGIELTVFGNTQKQIIYLYTSEPEITAKKLGLILKKSV